MPEVHKGPTLHQSYLYHHQGWLQAGQQPEAHTCGRMWPWFLETRCQYLMYLLSCSFFLQCILLVPLVAASHVKAWDYKIKKPCPLKFLIAFLYEHSPCAMKKIFKTIQLYYKSKVFGISDFGFICISFEPRFRSIVGLPGSYVYPLHSWWIWLRV